MKTRFSLSLAALVCCALLASCGGGSSHSDSTTNTTGQGSSGTNVQPIVVNSGPAQNYANGAFTDVTVCVPGTSTCQTISGVLVDTGSVGLRILSSALTLNLPQQQSASGDPVVECLPFLFTYTWGPVETADIKMAGETASSTPIQVLSDTAYPVASNCTDFGLTSADTLESLGANGLLGVGMYLQDCGTACAQSSSYGLYYQCPSAGCQPITESTTAQVQNPVALFATNNNGVLIELPASSGPQATLSGSLIFGIGTESNNALGGASIYAPDAYGNFTTQYRGQSYSTSFIDSGSNGIFFLDNTTTGIPVCTDANSFYCPASVESLSAITVGTNGTQGTIGFSVANADSLFSSGNDAVFGQLAGPNPGSFDWGLPFFYGRNTFTAIETKSTPQGVGPYWAY